MKEIEINHGAGIIDIVHDGFLTYIKFIRPATLIWPDCEGSVGEYLVVKDCSVQERKELLDRFAEAFNSGQKDLIFNCVESFLSLLANGTYRVEICESQPEYEIFYNARLESSHPVLFDWARNYLKTIDVRWCTENFYAYEGAYVFTQPFEKIDPERVLYYEKKIAEGKRPTVVVLSALYNWRSHSGHVSTQSTHGFVLDGHHKLIAYQNQKSAPEVVRIVKVVDALKNTDDALEETKGLLFAGQIEHILKNRERK